MKLTSGQWLILRRQGDALRRRRGAGERRGGSWAVLRLRARIDGGGAEDGTWAVRSMP